MHEEFFFDQRLTNQLCFSPAYDMIALALIVKGDTQELALSLNSKKEK
jgi:hypothetical protein